MGDAPDVRLSRVWDRGWHGRCHHPLRRRRDGVAVGAARPLRRRGDRRFFPVVPSESLVVTAGVFAAATGEPSLPLVIIAAALGAITGDHFSYLIGTRASGKVAERRAF